MGTHGNDVPKPILAVGTAFPHCFNLYGRFHSICTRDFIFCLKCAKIISSWGSAPDSAGEAQYGGSQFQNPEVFPSHKTMFSLFFIYA